MSWQQVGKEGNKTGEGERGVGIGGSEENVAARGTGQGFPTKELAT